MGPFVEPAWDAPIDVDACLRALPAGGTIKGMFPGAIVAEAERRGFVVHVQRDRYLPFLDYPVPEHAALLAEAAPLFYPGISLRRALRKLGRAAMPTFMQTTIGKVVMKQEPDIDALFGIVRHAYEIALKRPCIEIEERGDSHAILRLRDLYFLDSHHVGAIESFLRHRGLQASIRVHSESLVNGEFLCSWE
jgi:uncharacterized protein (TIGR02265 family)